MTIIGKNIALFERQEERKLIVITQQKDAMLTTWIWNVSNVAISVQSVALEESSNHDTLEEQAPFSLFPMTYHAINIHISSKGVPQISKNILVNHSNQEILIAPIHIERGGILTDIEPSSIKEEIIWKTQAILNRQGQEERHALSSKALHKYEQYFFIKQKNVRNMQTFLQKWAGKYIYLPQMHLVITTTGANAEEVELPLRSLHDTGEREFRLPFDDNISHIFLRRKSSKKSHDVNYIEGTIQDKTLLLTTTLKEDIPYGEPLIPLLRVLCDGVTLEEHSRKMHRMRMITDALITPPQNVLQNIRGYPVFTWSDRLFNISSTVDSGIIITSFQQKRSVHRIREERRILKYSMMIKRAGKSAALLSDVTNFFHRVMEQTHPFWMPCSFASSGIQQETTGVIRIKKEDIKGTFLPCRQKNMLKVTQTNRYTFLIITGFRESKRHIDIFFDSEGYIDSSPISHISIMTLCSLEKNILFLEHQQIYTQISFQVKEVLQ